MAKKTETASEGSAASEESLNGSNIHPATLKIADHEYQLGDFVREAFTASKLSAAEWNALSEDEHHARIDAVIVGLGGPSSLPPQQSDKVECAVLYDNVYGKHDDIIELDANIAEAAYAAGYVDTHPNAMKAIRRAAEKASK